MRVYLVAAPEDQEEAEKLAAYLKRFGVFIRTEFGQMAYPPAQHGEFTLALWSRNAMMSSRQMMLTNRAIDAWEEGRLVMARMDPGLSPRGLADLDMVDLSFAGAREHRYHDVLNAIRGMEDQRRAALQSAAHERVAQAEAEDPHDRETGAKQIETVMVQPRASTTEAPKPPPSEPALELPGAVMPQDDSATVAARSKGVPFLVLVIVLIVAGIFGFLYMMLGWGLTLPGSSVDPGSTPTDPSTIDPQDRTQVGDLVIDYLANPLVWGGVIGGVMLIGLMVLLMRRPGSSKKASISPEVHEEMADEISDPIAPKPSETPPEPASSAAPVGHDAFVSYSHANAETVIPIFESIEETGISVWIDREEMRAGQNWAGQIVRAIKASDRFCIMCSSQAFESDHVRREVYLADKYGKTMVPIRLDEAPMPEDIEYFLIGRQWIDLFALDEDERLGAIQAVLNTPEN